MSFVIFAAAIVLPASSQPTEVLVAGALHIAQHVVSGGPWHGCDKIVLSRKGSETVTFSSDSAAFPIFTDAQIVANDLVFLVGWSAGNGGNDSFAAWLVYNSASALAVVDELDFYKPQAATPVRVAIMDGVIAIYSSDHCSSDSGDSPSMLSSLFRRKKICDAPILSPDHASNFQEYDEGFVPIKRTKNASLRVMVRVRDGRFVF